MNFFINLQQFHNERNPIGINEKNKLNLRFQKKFTL